MKRNLAALLCVGLLASCTTTTADINTTLDKTCTAMNTAYAVFSAATVSGEISNKTITKVNAAYDSALIVCDGDVVNATDALVRVTFALATITKTFKEI